MPGTGLSSSAGDQLHPTRRKIILALKQHGGMTTAQLAELLGITSMGVRRHLITLERDRLVGYDVVQRGKGRPSYIYRLSVEAENLFPNNYATLIKELLSCLAAKGSADSVNELFNLRALRRIRQAQARLGRRPLRERVAGLAEILSADGFLAEWEQLDESTFCLREHNCAVHQVANEYRVACDSELAYLQAVLAGAEVTRDQHIIAGDRVCAYTIRQSQGGAL